MLWDRLLWYNQGLLQKLCCAQISRRMLKRRLLWVPERDGKILVYLLCDKSFSLWGVTGKPVDGANHWAYTDQSAGSVVTPHLFLVFQDDHKLSLDELHRKYGTDLSRVSRLCFPSLFALIGKGAVSAQSTSQREIWVVCFFSFFFFCLISALPVKFPRLWENCWAHKYSSSSSHCTASMQCFSDFVL